MPTPLPAALWLLKNYDTPHRGIAVAGCFHRTFSTPDGERVLDDLRRYCHIYDTTAAPGRDGLDQAQTLINEGRRQAYLHIVGLLGVSEADLNIESKPDDERSDRRSSDGSDPRPRYTGARDPGLDGPEPVASASSTGTGDAGGNNDAGAGSEHTES